MSDDTITTDAPAPIAEVTPAPAKKAATKRPSRAKTDDAPTKYKCAFCGKTDVFTTATVGEQSPVLIHGCPQSDAALHQWWLETMTRRDAPAPTFAL